MAGTSLETSSVLGIEIGSVHTRAFLFDVVEGNYRFISAAVVPSSHLAPAFDVSEGTFAAINRLQEITGRALLSHEGDLIIPTQAGGEGIDHLVLTTSCGPSLQLVALGLLSDVSLETARKLAYSTYGSVVESIGINDRRPIHQQLDAILAAKPDVLIFAGGTTDGANRSVLRMAELVISALRLIPRVQRPSILLSGNPALSEKLRESLDRFTLVKNCDNIRPSIQTENLAPAMKELSSLVMEIQQERIGGLKRLASLATAPPQLSNHSLYNVIRFLGHQYDPAKGVLGLDIGGSYSVAAYADHQTSTLHTFDYGLGTGVERVLEKSSIADLTRWLDGSSSDDEVRDYLWQRSLYPESLSSTPVELNIELAATRQILRLMMRELVLRKALPRLLFEPILFSGSAINRTATQIQSLLVILDGVQPLGISPLILDKHGILPILGAAAFVNPLLVVHVLESSAFTNLATVVNVVSRVRTGSTILNARLIYGDGNFIDAEIKQGSIVSLPLEPGASAELRLKLVRNAMIETEDIGSAPVKVNGGVCGVVLDARGRPLRLPKDPEARRELFDVWELMLGGKR